LQPLSPTDLAKLRAEFTSVDGRTFLAWAKEAETYCLEHEGRYKDTVAFVRNAIKRRLAFRSGGLKPKGDRKALSELRMLAE
jgi:hypothetical protein